ncbi:MAG TPA: hypothetical protein VN370_01035 [Desulfitobacteriaceae bacterium]|nr:hypothetical protein [Desulfitobacteriaceae bacterium]
MLSKLLKYEIKATGRVFLPFFLSLLLFAGISKLISSLSPQQWDTTPAILSMIIYVIIMAGMFIMTFVVMIQRFYKNLLSEEGYLMFTLPTRPWKHIICKLLISVMWMAASVIIAMISILIIAYEKGVITEGIGEIIILFSRLNDRLGASVSLLTLEILVGVLIGLVSWILLIYASIAIGHLFSKHKILASFGAFIVLNTLSQILFLLLSLTPATITNFFNIHISIDNIAGWHLMELMFAYGIILYGLLSTGYFTITNFILSKRLNLE